MQKKVIIIFSLLLLAGVLIIMAIDFFSGKKQNLVNPYEYGLDDLRFIDSSEICYNEIASFAPDIENPHGIAIDESDWIYICGDDRVMIYDKSGKKLFGFQTGGHGTCITVGPEGDIFIGMLDYILHYNEDRRLVKKWEKPNDRAVYTSLVAIGDALFAADAGNKIVYRYDYEGNVVNEIGKKDTLQGIPGFVIPSPYFDVAMGRDNELWVVNSGMHSFEAYTQEGTLISTWKRTSMQLDGFSGCCNPSHMTILSDGSFVTCEKGIERIKIHTPTGDYKCVVATPDYFDKDTVGLDVAVDSEDRIYVLDPVRGEVRVFVKE